MDYQEFTKLPFAQQSELATLSSGSLKSKYRRWEKKYLKASEKELHADNAEFEKRKEDEQKIRDERLSIILNSGTITDAFTGETYRFCPECACYKVQCCLHGS